MYKMIKVKYILGTQQNSWNTNFVHQYHISNLILEDDMPGVKVNRVIQA